jgi:putative oxidoreductase
MNKTLHYLIRPMSYGRYADAGLLLLRFGPAFTMAYVHGWDKLVHFGEYSADFYNFLGLGGAFSLALTVIAELFCSILIVIGLGTRLACIPLIITMMVIVFDLNADNPIYKFESPLLFMMIFVVLMITGAGRYSLDYKLFSKAVPK